jgi:hypothetical protein
MTGWNNSLDDLLDDECWLILGSLINSCCSYTHMMHIGDVLRSLPIKELNENDSPTVTKVNIQEFKTRATMY